MSMNGLDVNLILVSPKECDKSSIANTILGYKFFDINDEPDDGTIRIRIEQIDEYVVVDILGFGDSADANNDRIASYRR